MQFFAGQPIRKLAPKSAAARAAVEEAVLAFFRQVLVDGVFHGDPHGGNLLVGDDGTLCMIDLGLVGRVAPEQREAMVRLAMAHFTGDTGTMAHVMLKMGTPTQRIKLGEFKAEIDQIRKKYLDVSSLGEADTAGFIGAFSALAARHRIRLPRDMAVLAKAAGTLEGIVRTLHPDIDLVALARPLLEDIVRQRLSPQRLLGEMLGEGGSMASMLRTVPGQIDQLLHDFESGHLQLRALTPELDELPALCTGWPAACRWPPFPGCADRGGDPGAAGRRFDADDRDRHAAGAGLRAWLGGVAGLACTGSRQAAQARPAAAPVATLSVAPRGA